MHILKEWNPRIKELKNVILFASLQGLKPPPTQQSLLGIALKSLEQWNPLGTKIVVSGALNALILFFLLPSGWVQLSREQSPYYNCPKADTGSFVTSLISPAIIFRSHSWVLIALPKIQTICMLFLAKLRRGKLYMSNEGTAQKIRNKAFRSHQHAWQTCEGREFCSSTNRVCQPRLLSSLLLKESGLT